MRHPYFRIRWYLQIITICLLSMLCIGCIVITAYATKKGAAQTAVRTSSITNISQPLNIQTSNLAATSITSQDQISLSTAMKNCAAENKSETKSKNSNKGQDKKSSTTSTSTTQTATTAGTGDVTAQVTILGEIDPIKFATVHPAIIYTSDPSIVNQSNASLDVKAVSVAEDLTSSLQDQSQTALTDPITIGSQQSDVLFIDDQNQNWQNDSSAQNQEIVICFSLS